MIPSYLKSSTLRTYFPQWFVGIGAFLIMVELGILCGWSSPYLARLTKPDSPIPLTSDQAAWVASFLNLGRLLGAICGAISVNYLGSKKSLTLSIVPLGICWIFTMGANHFIWLYAARVSGGFGLGMSYSCFALYVGEVALPEIRGALVSLAMAGGGCIGTVVSSICGSYQSLILSSVIYLIPCIIILMLFMCLPESPHKLVKVMNYEKAKRSIAWYLPGYDVNKELEVVKNLVDSANSEGFFDKIRKCKSGPIRRAMVLIVILFTFMQITGLNSIIFYMESIFRQNKFTLINPANAVIYVNASGFFAAVLSVVLIDKFGRRFLLILSSAGVAVSMAALGSHAFMISNQYDISQLQWVPVASAFLFIITYMAGLMVVPSTVLSEIFPSDVKCIAGFLASFVGAVWSFVATRSFQPLIDAIGEAYVFWMHGTFAFILIPYVYLCMPETKGKTLQEIQNQLMNK